MFKVYEKFLCRYAWIRVSKITAVYRTEDDDYTVIRFGKGEFLYVTESVEEILEAINSEV